MHGIIFDLDGLLVDSEPTWRRAEIEVFATVGVTLDHELAGQTMGLRVDRVTDHWFERFPWTGPTRAEVTAAVVGRVEALLREQCQPQPGAVELVRRLQGQGRPVALASSSPHVLISAALEGLDLAFEVIRSAQDEPAGKPDPAVYLSAARALGLSPRRCVAVEDSPPGLEAARRAGMATVCVPSTPFEPDADLVLASLAELTPDLLDRFLARLEAA